MLKLYINNQRVDLLADVSITLSMSNPFFESDFIPVAHSLDVNIPATPTNCAILSYPNRLTPSAGLLTERDFNLYFNEILIFTGSVSLVEWTPTIITIQLLGATIIGELDAKLYQLPLPTPSFGYAEEYYDHRTDTTYLVPTFEARMAYHTYFRALESETSPDFIAAPISLAGVDQTSANSVINLDNHLIAAPIFPDGVDQTLANSVINLDNPDYTDYVGPVLPSFMVGYLLNAIIPGCGGLTVDTDLSQLALITNYNSAYRGVEDGFSLRTLEDYACYNIDPDTYEVTFDLADCLPDVSCADFVKELLKVLCASFYLVKGEPVITYNKDILSATDYVDWSAKILDDTTTSIISPIIYSFSFDNATGLETLSEEEVVMTYDTVYDMVEAQNFEVSLQQTLDTAQVFEVAVDDDLVTNDLAYDVMIDSLASFGGDEDTSYDTLDIATSMSVAQCSPRINPYFVSSTDTVYSYYICPEVDAAEAGVRPTTMTIGQYVGLATPPQGVTAQYPQINAIGDSSKISLVNGALYDKYHQPLADYYANPRRQVEAQIKLGALDLAELDFRRKIYYNGLYYFLGSLEVTLTLRSIGVADITILEIKK